MLPNPEGTELCLPLGFPSTEVLPPYQSEWQKVQSVVPRPPKHSSILQIPADDILHQVASAALASAVPARTASRGVAQKPEMAVVGSHASGKPAGNWRACPYEELDGQGSEIQDGTGNDCNS